MRGIEMKLLVGLLLMASGIVAVWGFRHRPAVSESGAPLASGAGPVPVMVELFTSEGCSSCPPADVLLSKLDQQPINGVEVIVLSEHVDYWNSLGWQDPFSSAGFSERQRAYGDAFRTSSVYTPQMIVDGQQQFVGSDERRAHAAIIKAAKETRAKVELKLTSNKELSVTITDLPAVTQDDTADVLLAVTESNLSSDVPRGENAGRSLKHTAVVRQLQTVGEVAAGSNKFTANAAVPFNKGWRTDNLRIVVFIQERGTRRVLGVASLKISA
jgi:hypothetical protein